MSKPGSVTFFRVETVSSDGPRDGIWRIAWDEGVVLYNGWQRAVDALIDLLADHTFTPDTILFAGPFGCPWVLSSYLDAAEAARTGDRENVFDAYAISATQLLAKNTEYQEKLMEPWNA